MTIPPDELHDTTMLDNAAGLGEKVRCRRPGELRSFTERMPWNPVLRPSGFFYPKRGDRAVLGYPPDGPPVILQWWPAADAVPDVSF